MAPADRSALLQVAREAIEARLRGREAPAPPGSSALAQHHGAFVTLTRRADGELRGCIGVVSPARPLVEAVAHAAVAAAVDDRRFDSLTPAELPSIRVEISVLGPLEPIRAEGVEVGRHGLLVRYGGRQGLLLPQVATDHGWDRETFLAKTCWKAGLSEETWRKPGVEILAFTAQVFGEE